MEVIMSIRTQAKCERCDLHEWLDTLVVDRFLVQMMRRRDELTFRQEMKFRNKLVEYLTDWIMGNSHQVNVQGDICSMSRYVLLLGVWVYALCECFSF